MKVGVFDSGIGGLTVLKKLIEKYPLNDYIYYGDTINIPYGDKDIDTLYILSSKIVEFFLKEKVDLIVIACGTVSSNCYFRLKTNYNIDIIDIISPTIKYINDNNYNDIGVIATTRTINSHVFKNNLDILVYEEACSEFVELIESDRCDLIDVNKHLDKINSNTIVLGCTHFPLIKDKINKNCIDMADNILLESNEGNGKVIIYFSNVTDRIINNTYKILDREIKVYKKKL